MRRLIKNKDVATGGIFLLFSLYLFREISRFDTTGETMGTLGPDVFPLVLAATLCLLSVILLVRGMRRPVSALVNPDWGKAPYAKAGLIAVLVMSFTLFAEHCGFIIWASVVICIAQFCFGERRPLLLLGLSLACALVLYGIFVPLLGVPLP